MNKKPTELKRYHKNETAVIQNNKILINLINLFRGSNVTCISFNFISDAVHQKQFSHNKKFNLSHKRLPVLSKIFHDCSNVTPDN